MAFPQRGRLLFYVPYVFIINDMALASWSFRGEERQPTTTRPSWYLPVRLVVSGVFLCLGSWLLLNNLLGPEVLGPAALPTVLTGWWQPTTMYGFAIMSWLSQPLRKQEQDDETGEVIMTYPAALSDVLYGNMFYFLVQVGTLIWICYPVVSPDDVKLYIYYCLVSVFAVAMWSLMLIPLVASWRSRLWLPVLGVLSESRLVEHREANSQGHPVRVWTIDLTYRYEWQGQTYQGNRIHPFARLSLSDKEEAADWMARYSRGTTIEVFVNPSNPTQSGLKKGLLPALVTMYLFILSLPALMLLVPVFLA